MQPRRAPQGLSIAAFSAFAVLVFLFFVLRSESIQNLPLPTVLSDKLAKTSRLHVLIVATNANLDLCRLLLSLSVLSYPQPVLIDWEGAGTYNASETHLAKITGTLRYLESLPSSKDNDMILMLDGYDVFMQLGPDVLLKRYFATTAAANGRLQDQFGVRFMKEHGLYDSIIFGPDKTCWPPDPRRAACWAVPESSLDPKAFGRDTDQFTDPQLARPRWLNSGTIMGPAADMRAMFQGTAKKINETFSMEYGFETSDQMYMSDLWADQEYMRSLSRYAGKVSTPTAVPTTLAGIAEPTELPGVNTTIKALDLSKQRVFVPKFNNSTSSTSKEFHIGLDYESCMFQTMAFYENFLHWTKFNDTEIDYESEKVGKKKLHFQRDISKSKKPFETLKGDRRVSRTRWQDVKLGVNVATGHIFPVLHFTGNKIFRDEWWTRMWFFPHAERLLFAATDVKEYGIGKNAINGIKWQKNVPYTGFGVDEETGIGAWVDKGEGDHKSWDDLCGVHEPLLFSGAMPSRPPEFPPEPEATPAPETTSTLEPTSSSEFPVPTWMTQSTAVPTSSTFTTKTHTSTKPIWIP